MATALRNRLSVVFDGHLAPVTMTNDPSWPATKVHHPPPANPATWFMSSVGHAGTHGNFGSTMSNLMTLVVHETDGWCSRNRAAAMVHGYVTLDENTPAHQSGWGVGPQFYISSDGSAFQLIGAAPFGTPLQTWHTPGTSAVVVNGQSIGVETGHSNGGDFHSINIAPDVATAKWIAASGTPNQTDIPNQQLWLRLHADDALNENDPALTELLSCWWATASYDGPLRETITRPMMVFSEWQYRTWALMARAVTGEYYLPRNLPLLPYQATPGSLDLFNRVMLADESFGMQKLNLIANAGMTAASFGAQGNLLGHYSSAVWDNMFRLYRGIHGHHFANADHDCPGPILDWWRLARSVWDWWWFPFDFDAPASVTPALVQREYRPHLLADGTTRVVPNLATPLREHYWDADAAAPAPPPAAPPEPETRYRGRIVQGILGTTSSPETYGLVENTPIYALANGKLVAAWFPAQELEQVSLAFALVRHEVFYRPIVFQFPVILAALAGGPFAAPVTLPDIDYDVEPISVFSLYMHLSQPNGITYGNPSDANPDWLNRVLIRLKECNLGIGFHTRDAAAAHPVVSATTWGTHPPGSARQRPPLLDGWTLDSQALTTFVNDLSHGHLAVVAQGNDNTPIEILLGDFMGNAGNIRWQNAAASYGVRVEVFSNRQISAFNGMDTTGWTPPLGPGLPPPALRYASEWARDLTQAERSAVSTLNGDPDLMKWWPDVSTATQLDLLTPADGRLPLDGVLYHYSPLDFMHWLNNVTWASEWPKYGITDDPQGRLGHGTPTPRPNRPRSRLG